MKAHVNLSPDEQDDLHDRLKRLQKPTIVEQLAMIALDRMLQNRVRAKKFKDRKRGK